MLNEKKVNEMVNALQYHSPSPEVQAKITQIRAYGIEYVKSVSQLLNDSREASVWFTNFQTGQQMAIASLVLGEPVGPTTWGCSGNQCAEPPKAA